MISFYKNILLFTKFIQLNKIYLYLIFLTKNKKYNFLYFLVYIFIFDIIKKN